MKKTNKEFYIYRNAEPAFKADWPSQAELALRICQTLAPDDQWEIIEVDNGTSEIPEDELLFEFDDIKALKSGSSTLFRFPFKPDLETRTSLKKLGFRWARVRQCWQCKVPINVEALKRFVVTAKAEES